jgi:hypothetical protein
VSRCTVYFSGLGLIEIRSSWKDFSSMGLLVIRSNKLEYLLEINLKGLGGPIYCSVWVNGIDLG